MEQEKKTRKKEDINEWIVGGTTLIGLGVGFIFFKTSIFLFIACLFIGIGIGLVLSPIVVKIKKD